MNLQELPDKLRATLLDQGLVRPETFAGEPAAQLQAALPPAIEVILKSFAELAGQASGRTQLWTAAHQAAATPGSPVPPPSAGLLKTVLDDRYHGKVNAIATEAGLKPGTAAQLLDTVAATALAQLGSLAAEHHWDAQQLAEWLRPRQFAAPVAAPLPAVAPAVAAMPAAAPTWFARHAGTLLVGVSVIAAAEFGYILSTRPGADAPVAAAPSVEAPGQYAAIPVASLSKPAAPEVARTKTAVPVVLKLKNGVRQVIGANSTESKLYQFLIDPSKEVDTVDPTKDWIGFDRIYFDSNKATLTNESLWQLSNVASILKRFPDAKIKIGGYTDNSGKPLSNLQLSRERAEAAKSSLVSLGVPADRLTAVGYGIIDNIAPNETEEGRALNRRVSLQITQK